jgi:ATP-dependent Clp protease ATP-binding subunit ClpA
MNWLQSLWKKLAGPSGMSGINFDDPTVDFTPRASAVLGLAQREAERLNHNFIGTEHLLLGLVKLQQGIACDVLRKTGLDLETVRREVEQQVGRGPDQKMTGHIPFTPRVKRVFELARQEAEALRHQYIGTEHLLLGMLREGDGVAARVLNNFNLDLGVVRQGILHEIDPQQFRGGEPAGPARRMPAWEELAEMEKLVPDFRPETQMMLALARREADRFHHSFVGTEHLLLGIILLGQGRAVDVLGKLGLNLEEVRGEVEQAIAPGPDHPAASAAPYTPRVKNVIQFAQKEASALQHTYLGTEHILLGLLREGDNVAARILINRGVRIESLRQMIL